MMREREVRQVFLYPLLGAPARCGAPKIILIVVAQFKIGRTFQDYFSMDSVSIGDVGNGEPTLSATFIVHDDGWIMQPS